MMRPDVLIFAPTAAGGLAEHVYYQGRALVEAGARVHCLAAHDFLNGRPCTFPVDRVLRGAGSGQGSRLRRRLSAAFNLFADQLRLAAVILAMRPNLVLLDSYVEYLAPVWVWPHIILGRLLGQAYWANLHDPVRSYRIGPAWWHALSVRLAYVPLRGVLIHDKPPSPSPIPDRVSVEQVPVGVYDLLPPRRSREDIRGTWGVAPSSRVFLAFGYVRDGKNLDLAIRALREVPEAFLVIAGSVASSKDRPFSFYQKLAADLGVAQRIVFREGFVTDQDLADYFEGTDYVLLTYASSFHSQSGVLNVAARARRPVLASSAPSPLLVSVRTFKLGVVIEPDSAAAVATGMRTLVTTPVDPAWAAYYEAASWGANAKAILRQVPRLKSTQMPS